MKYANLTHQSLYIHDLLHTHEIAPKKIKYHSCLTSHLGAVTFQLVFTVGTPTVGKDV